MSGWYGATAIAAVIVATVLIGAFGLRLSRTTSDFYVASRSVTPVWNASAIGGEYLSAASFLGIAGLILTYGADMLWFPVGYTAGYLVLLVLVAAPLRRSGAYTLPDFAEAHGDYARLHTADGSHLVRVPLTTLEEQWSAAGFVRIHRRYLVALAHIDEVAFDSGHGTVRVGDDELSVSRRHLRGLRDTLVRRSRPGRDQQ